MHSLDLISLGEEYIRLIQKKDEMINRVTEFGLPIPVVDINEDLPKQLRLIHDLREDNRLLVHEGIEKLRSQLLVLETKVECQSLRIDIDKLMKRHKHKCYSALRSLITTAKSMTTHSFSPIAQQLIRDKSMEILDSYFDPSLIYEALAVAPKQYDAAMKEIFYSVYPDYCQEDELFTDTDEI